MAEAPGAATPTSPATISINLISGQNPASTEMLTRELLKMLMATEEHSMMGSAGRAMSTHG